MNNFRVFFGDHEFRNVAIVYFSTTHSTALFSNKPDEILPVKFSVGIFSEENYEFEMPNKWSFGSGTPLLITMNDVNICQGLFVPSYGLIKKHDIQFTSREAPVVWRF